MIEFSPLEMCSVCVYMNTSENRLYCVSAWACNTTLRDLKSQLLSGTNFDCTSEGECRHFQCNLLYPMYYLKKPLIWLLFTDNTVQLSLSTQTDYGLFQLVFESLKVSCKASASIHIYYAFTTLLFCNVRVT